MSLLIFQRFEVKNKYFFLALTHVFLLVFGAVHNLLRHQINDVFCDSFRLVNNLYDDLPSCESQLRCLFEGSKLYFDK